MLDLGPFLLGAPEERVYIQRYQPRKVIRRGKDARNGRDGRSIWLPPAFRGILVSSWSRTHMR